MEYQLLILSQRDVEYHPTHETRNVLILFRRTTGYIEQMVDTEPRVKEHLLNKDSSWGRTTTRGERAAAI